MGKIKDWFSKYILRKTEEDVEHLRQTFEKDVWLRVKVDALQYFKHPSEDGSFVVVFAKPTRHIPHVNLHHVQCHIANIDKNGKIRYMGTSSDINLFYFEVIEDQKLIKLLDCSIAKREEERRKERERDKKEEERILAKMAKVYPNVVKKSTC